MHKKVVFLMSRLVVALIMVVGGELYAAAHEHPWQHEVVKISDELYLGTVKGRPHLSLVMLKINPFLLREWKEFARVKERDIRSRARDGIEHFKKGPG